MHGGRLVSGTLSRVPCRVGIQAIGDAYAVEIRHVSLHVNNWILSQDENAADGLCEACGLLIPSSVTPHSAAVLDYVDAQMCVLSAAVI